MLKKGYRTAVFLYNSTLLPGISTVKNSILFKIKTTNLISKSNNQSITVHEKNVSGQSFESIKFTLYI